MSTATYEQGVRAQQAGERRIVPAEILVGDEPEVGAGTGVADALDWYRGWDDANLAPTCDECGRALTGVEEERLRQDIDFVEHHGHLIRCVEGRRR